MTTSRHMQDARQLLGAQIYILDNMDKGEVDLPLSLLGFGPVELTFEAVNQRFQDLALGAHAVSAELVRELRAAGIDTTEVLQRVALRLAAQEE